MKALKQISDICCNYTMFLPFFSGSDVEQSRISGSDSEFSIDEGEPLMEVQVYIILILLVCSTLAMSD